MMSYGGGLVSYLTLTSLFASPVLIIIAFLIGQTLIVREYYGHTQRFVEALPIKRGYLAMVKFVIGFASLLLLAVGVWLYSISLAIGHEPVSNRFAALMFLRLIVYVFTLWSLVFTFSLLGRLRIPLIAAAALVVSVADTYTSFELDRFGPTALINADLFSSERTILPLTEVIESLILGGLLLAVSTMLVVMRDGSAIEKLAVPMTRGEKTFLLIVFILGGGMYSYFDIESEESVFAFTDSFVAKRHRIEVAYLEQPYESDARILADFLTEPIRSLDALITFPTDEFTVRIALMPALKSAKYRMELGSKKQGLLVNANFETQERWSLEFFGAFIIHQILQVASSGRVTLEPNHAFLDGFSLWWILQHKPNLGTASRIDPFMLQALYASEIKPVNRNMLRQWDVTSDVLGDSLGMTLSYSGWRILEETVGRETARRLAQYEYNRPVRGDVRDWWSDWRSPWEDRFRTATSMDWEEFIEIWVAGLDALRSDPDYARALDDLPRLSASISAQVSPIGERILKYELNLDKPLRAGNKCVAIHARLPSYDVPVGNIALREVDMPRPDVSALHIDQIVTDYASGSRVYAAIECEVSRFALPLRLGFARLTLP